MKIISKSNSKISTLYTRALRKLSNYVQIDIRKYQIKNLFFYLDVSQNNEFMYAIDNYEKKEIEFIIAKMGEFIDGGVFVDVGANIGLFSVFAGKAFPKSKILAFEADQHNKNRMLENLKLNNISNVIIENYGISNANKFEEFLINTKHRGANSFYKHNNHRDKNLISKKVECFTLSSALEKNNISNIDILKMDIEGYEYPVLKEFFKPENIKAFPIYVLLEEWGSIISKQNESVVELMIKNNYTLIDHHKDNFFFKLNF